MFMLPFKLNLCEPSGKNVIVLNSLDEMHIIFQNFVSPPILTLFYISARMCITNRGNLRIRDFGVISTIPSWAQNKPGMEKKKCRCEGV